MILSRTPETLWLRILGRGNVQKQAIDKLEALPVDNPFRENALRLLLSLQRDLEFTQNQDQDDQELIMRLSSRYLQEKEEAVREGEQRGIQQGIQQERRTMIENLLRLRFGAVDEEIKTIIKPILALTS